VVANSVRWTLVSVPVISGLVTVLALGAGLLGDDKVSAAVLSAAPARAETPPSPEVVKPEECVVAPRSIGELLETVHAAYSSAMPTASAGGPVVVEYAEEGLNITISGKPWIAGGQVASEEPGPVVDESTLAAVNATLRERVACQNAGDAARFLALHTDDWIANSFASAAKPDPDGKPHVPEESWKQLLTSPLYEVYDLDWRPAPGIVGMWSLPDGRVAAITNPGLSPREKLSSNRSNPLELCILAKVDDTWLVDFSQATVSIHQ
jgi:hypothetical protein